jgi:tyrosyl-tRNA synthetase
MEKSGMEPQCALTLPLLEGTDGVQKMSKSYGNYIGLTDVPADMFGKVMSIPDELIIKYYRLCTSVPVDEVDDLQASLESGSGHPNALKRRLAREVVALYHDAEASEAAERTFDSLFKRHEIPDDIPEIAVELEDEVYVPGLLHELGLAGSASDARRLIDGGGVRVGGEPLAPHIYRVARAHVENQVVQVGKRRFARPVTRS